MTASDARGASGEATTEASSMRTNVGHATSESDAAGARYQDGAKRLATDATAAATG